MRRLPDTPCYTWTAPPPAPHMNHAQLPVYYLATPISVPVAHPLPEAIVIPVDKREIDHRDIIKATLRAMGQTIYPTTFTYIDSINRRPEDQLYDDTRSTTKRRRQMMRLPFGTDREVESMTARYGRPTKRQRRTTRWSDNTLCQFSHMIHKTSPMLNPDTARTLYYSHTYKHDTPVT